MENPLPAGLVALGKKAMLAHGAIGFARGRGLMNPIRSVLTRERRDALKQWARAQTPSELALDIMGLEQSRQKLLDLGKPVQEVAESMKILSDEVDHRRRRRELNPSMELLNMSQFDRYVKKAPERELVEMIDQIQKEKRKFRGTSAEDQEARQGIDQVLLTIAHELNDREDRPLLNPGNPVRPSRYMQLTDNQLIKLLLETEIDPNRSRELTAITNEMRARELLRGRETFRKYIHNPFGPRTHFVHELNPEDRVALLKKLTATRDRMGRSLQTGKVSWDNEPFVLQWRAVVNRVKELEKELRSGTTRHNPFGPRARFVHEEEIGKQRLSALRRTHPDLVVRTVTNGPHRIRIALWGRRRDGSYAHDETISVLHPRGERNPMPKERDVNNIFKGIIKEMAKLGQGPDVNTIEGQRVLRALKVAANSLSEAERNIHTFEATKPGLFGRIIGKRAGTPRQPHPKVARALL